jgi:CheY-like chemotaxis protein
MNKRALNVLLVDDDAAVGRYLVPDVLEGEGHRLEWRDSAPTALEYIVAVGALPYN